VCFATTNKKDPVWKIINKARDSKKLSEGQREKWYEIAKDLEKQGKIFFHISFVSNKIIDKKGISYSLKWAINNSLKKLKLKPEETRILLDGGLRAPEKFKNQKTIIKGDDKEPIISLASIVAKVTRDRYMKKFAKTYPDYGFEKNKGYGTEKHIKALKKYGISAIHRRSFLKRFLGLT
jgi:ribonuclease HII